MRQGKAFRAGNKYDGFTLFEMVVTICSIVILYMIAEQRLNDLPAAAERANFHAVLEQIKTGVNFEMVTKLASGRSAEIQELEASNPIDFLIEPPANYRGELDVVTDKVERRNAWYFETSTGELVYVVGASSVEDVVVTVAGVPVNMGQIRLKLSNIYAGDEDTGSGDERLARRSRDAPAGQWEGLMLLPVRKFTWERRAEQPVPLE